LGDGIISCAIFENYNFTTLSWDGIERVKGDKISALISISNDCRQR
jgi:hypothetical protein